MIRIGTLLHGYCGGYFGRDSYSLKRVEALGTDWVVARDDMDRVVFADVEPEKLEEYAKPQPIECCCEECYKLSYPDR